MTTRKQGGVRRGAVIALAITFVGISGQQAQAHLVSTGLGPLYDGIAHLLLSPADLAVAVVLVLLAAMRGPRQGRWMVALLPTVWLAGGLCGFACPSIPNLDYLTGFSFLVVGGLVAADLNLPLNIVATIGILVGGLHGFLTGVALTATPSSGLELAGTIAALMIIITLVAGLVVSIKVYWARISVRVLGSWIAATGLLIIGWCFRTAK